MSGEGTNMRIWFRSVPSSQFCESPQLFSLLKKLFCWARWGFDFYLFFFFSLWHRKETHRKNSRKINFYFLHACVSHSWPSQSSFLETAAEMSCNYLSFFFFPVLVLMILIIMKNLLDSIALEWPDVCPLLLFTVN